VAAALLCFGVAALASTQRVQAQARRPVSSPDSARLVADLFFRAIADEKWDAAARLLDTTAIRRMVTEQLRYRPERDRRELTVEDFMRGDPNKPREVAEYELKRLREQMAKRDSGERFSSEFHGVRSAAELRALSTSQVAARYLQAKDQRVQFREFLRQSGCPDSTFTMPFRVHRILATALANDSVAYLLHDEGPEPSRSGYSEFPSVMILRLRGDGWAIVPTPNVMGPGGIVISGDGPCDSRRRR